MENRIPSLKCLKCKENLRFVTDSDGDGSSELFTLDTYHHTLICEKCRLYYMYCPECSNLVKNEDFAEYMSENYSCMSAPDIDPIKSSFVLLKFIGHELCDDCEECEENDPYRAFIPMERKKYGKFKIQDEMCEKCKSRGEIFTCMEKGKKVVYRVPVVYRDANGKLYDYCDEEIIDNDGYNTVVGKDGGCSHYWFCEKCNDIFSFCDK